MDNPKTILPYILASLTRKPYLSNSFTSLVLDVEARLRKDGIKCDHLSQKVRHATHIGEELGIISVTDDDNKEADKLKVQLSQNNLAESSATNLPSPPTAQGRQKSRKTGKIHKRPKSVTKTIHVGPRTRGITHNTMARTYPLRQSVRKVYTRGNRYGRRTPYPSIRR